LDVYAVTAFRIKKDVPFALGLMAATNITYHVADMTGAGMIEVPGEDPKPSVWLVTIAVLIVVAIVWRIHELLDNHEEKKPTGEDRTDESEEARTDAGRTPRTDAPRTDAGRTPRTDAGRTPRT
ncbi:hypothetical protein ADL27_45210, partial [Streptomyces sp. NRRL F-6602]